MHGRTYELELYSNCIIDNDPTYIKEIRSSSTLCSSSIALSHQLASARLPNHRFHPPFLDVFNFLP